MQIDVKELPEVEPGRNPLLVSHQYAAQLAGSSIFFQVVSGLSEHPVRIIVHDRLSGERSELTITRSGKVRVLEEPEVLVKVVAKVAAPKTPRLVTLPAAAPSVGSAQGLQLKTPPAPKKVPTGAVPAAPVVVSPVAPPPKTLSFRIPTKS